MPKFYKSEINPMDCDYYLKVDGQAIYAWARGQETIPTWELVEGERPEGYKPYFEGSEQQFLSKLNKEDQDLQDSINRQAF